MDNVTPINGRTARGTFAKGVSGNPHGVSAKAKAIKDMQRGNEVLLTTLITEMVPHAARLHKALLRDKNLKVKEALELIALTYKYGIGTPGQAPTASKQNEADDTVAEIIDTMSDEKKAALLKLINDTTKGATPE